VVLIFYLKATEILPSYWSLQHFKLHLQKLTTVADGKTIDLLMAFMTYGTVHASDRSGAYLFLPDGPAQVCWNFGRLPSFSCSDPV
jgi:hypothetical protein